MINDSNGSSDRHIYLDKNVYLHKRGMGTPTVITDKRYTP
jgi:hypothetical protein